MIQSCYHCKGEESYQPVLPGAVAFTGGTACHVINSGRIQRKADRKNDGSCYERREQHADLSDTKSYDDGNDSSHYLGSQDGGNIIGACDSLHTGYVSKADAQDDRKGASQLEVSEFNEGEQLKKRADRRTK